MERQVKKVDCPKGKGKFCRVRKAPPKRFAKGSMRTVKQGKIRVVIGCPKGMWDTKAKRCKVGTRAATILYPIGHSRCRVCSR